MAKTEIAGGRLVLQEQAAEVAMQRHFFSSRQLCCLPKASVEYLKQGMKEA